MNQMNALDAGFYFAEDENAPLHVGAVMVFEGPPPSYGDLIRALLAKLPKAPRYRQRVRTSPLHLSRPVWMDDEHFQILYHVRHTAVPAPGGPEQLRNLAGRVFAQRLDLSKPLWELWLVEGLENGRWALISKTHHCMVDGIAGTDLMQALMDLRADAELPEVTEWRPEPPPAGPTLSLGSLFDVVTWPVRQLGDLPGLVRWLPNPGDLMKLAWAVGGSLPGTARRLVTSAARSLNGPIGPHRRWVWVEADLGEIKQVRTAFGGTVNDVILAAVTGGFRDLLGKRGDLRDGQIVRTMVPVSMRAGTERGQLNNRVTAVLVNLPVGEPDPQRRLAVLRDQMDDLKRSGQAVGADKLVGLADFAAPTLMALGSRVAAKVPQQVLQTITTNVPGPRVPLYLLGRRLVELYPYIPLFNGIRIAVGIYSYLGRFYFGVNADFDAMPDIQVLADGIRAGFDELVEQAATAPATAG
ncbi:MAG TPA: wax ester/triacylglycerol synthase family O-acyltransferase [Pilimelia sp.]|nr:wax ester/triacylglycerol synthase family O-acyltransferase [Pilimelia sp.]